MLQNINGKYRNKDIVSIDQFVPNDLRILFSHIPKMKQIALKAKPSHILAGNIIALLFYEPSSRTFGSFSAAVKQLGGQTVEIINPQKFSSVAKGETFEDTIKVFEAYSDLIVIRHPKAGHAIKAAETATVVPVINAGDGTAEHPTQALLDLYTIYEKFKRLDNLTLVCAGDILHGRTIHSLLKGLSLFKNNTVFLLSPEELKLSRSEYKSLSDKLKIIEINSEKEIPKNAHVWYWTRVQKERFRTTSSYLKVKNKFIMTPELIKKHAGPTTILMHPLPRVGEIDLNVDKDKRAQYLRDQIRNGTYVRMALTALVLGKL